MQILDVIGAKRVLLPIVEFEEVTHSDGSITYTIEYENSEGDSISYGLDEAGLIVQIEHEAGIEGAEPQTDEATSAAMDGGRF